jgi:hypothetical protein
MAKKCSPWSEEDEAKLRRLAECGYTAARLSAAMNRPMDFLKRRAAKLGISLKQPQRLPVGERRPPGIGHFNCVSRSDD